jgi:hypothetical protein
MQDLVTPPPAGQDALTEHAVEIRRHGVFDFADPADRARRFAAACAAFADPAARAARARRFAAKKRESRKRARRACGPAKIAAVNDFLLMLGSHERLGAMLPLIEDEPAAIFWPIFMCNWPHCDATGAWNEWLVTVLRRVGPCPVEVYRAHAKDHGEFFVGLPRTFTIYRGGSRARINGAVSWTVDREVARGFAHGHRFIAVPDPVIASATINKADIFAAINNRSEREILALPGKITAEAAT